MRACRAPAKAGSEPAAAGGAHLCSDRQGLLQLGSQAGGLVGQPLPLLLRLLLRPANRLNLPFQLSGTLVSGSTSLLQLSSQARGLVCKVLLLLLHLLLCLVQRR